MATTKTIEIALDSVKFDADKYPRQKWDSATVSALITALDYVPPIEVNANYFLIDGYHRLQAHKISGRATIPAIIRDVPDDKVLWESAKRNSVHGKQLTLKEKEDLAKRFYKGNNTTEAEIAQALSVSTGKVSEWVSSIRKERDEVREQKILDLYLRCWTEERIAEEVGLTKQQVNNIVSSFFTSEETLHANPPDSLQVYNLWEFPAPDNPSDPEFPGLMPAQVVENLLWYYTKPFDLVVDPLGGSGTTLDVSLRMSRRCLCYDLNPTRPQEIVKHDISTGLPKLPALRRDGQIIKPQLVILDPPYWSQKKGDYSSDATNLANLPLDDFHTQVATVISQCAEYISPSGYVAFIISSTRKDGKVFDHTPHILSKIDFQKWTIAERIIVAYTTQQALAYHVTQAREGRYMLRLYRDLTILQPGFLRDKEDKR